MSLPGIGAQCSLDRCNMNDFLPIRCRCDKIFCKDHISPEAHSCTLLNQTYIQSQTSSPLQRCAFKGCNKPSLEAFVADNQDTEGRTPAICDRCRQGFCAIHREPRSHECSSSSVSQPTASKNEAGRALLAKLFPKSAVSESTSGATTSALSKAKVPDPHNPKKAAQLRQVELMKMRQRAKPGDPKDIGKNIPIGDKVYVKVRLEDRDEEGIFWLRKDIITGKAVDLLTAQFRVSSQSSPLCLVRFSLDRDDPVWLRNDQPLGSQVEDASSLELRWTSA